MFLATAAMLFGQGPAGWKVVKDRKGACQVSVPGDWKISEMVTSSAAGPDQSGVMVTSQPGTTIKPMNEVVQKAVGVDKMIENTPQRTFWAGKPGSMSGLPPVVGYHVTVPGKGGLCYALITIPKGGSEDLVKKISATVGPTN
jgi:hypothetical protein